MSESIIQNKSFQFSLNTVKLYKVLTEENEYIISKQLLRSGTSIGANVEEGTAAQTKKDFAYKMSIASKEARETKYWLRLLQESERTQIEVMNELNAIEGIIKILTSIVKTTRKNLTQHSTLRTQS